MILLAPGVPLACDSLNIGCGRETWRFNVGTNLETHSFVCRTVCLLKRESFEISRSKGNVHIFQIHFNMS
jgi:hypothetical protein